MRRLVTLPAGRRSKWVVLAVWLLIVPVAGTFGGKFEDAQKNEQSSFLPGDAESVKAIDAVEGLPSGDVIPAVVVYRRDGGLTPADRRQIGDERTALNRALPKQMTAFAAPAISKDRTTALLIANFKPTGESGVLLDAGDAIHERVGKREGGPEVKLTGAVGFSVDAVKVFDQINSTLLLATLALVFVLLILIYRSPIFWIIPFFSVVVAELCARAMGYGLAEAGVTINGQSAGILPVLVFGAGTDYALLLVARYREELRHHEDKHEAMSLALRRAGPAIVASSLTVIAALLCLVVAELNGTSGLGPISAMGIAVAMVAMMTLLPALLTICGRRAFWPFVPRTGEEGADETHGIWRHIAERVQSRPRPIWIGSVVVLAVMCLGLLALNSNLTQGNSFVGDVDSVEGQKLVSQAFPAGSNAPTDVIVPPGGSVAEVTKALAAQPGVASVRPVERGAAGTRLNLTLQADPYSTQAFDRIEPLRRVAKKAGGPDTLVGGPTAQERDIRVSAARDNRLVVPLALVVVFLILALLLRAITAPLMLIATVILSLLASLGVGALVFEYVFGFPGSDPSLPLFAFIFLVALGIDYNIFLMARVREESLKHGTRQGMLRGLAVTGAVITSAGIVLAGTFSILAVLPLVFLTEIGFVIAFGVLLDTFLVRSVLVPALTFELGDRIWWPSSLSKATGEERRPPQPTGEAEPSPAPPG